MTRDANPTIVVIAVHGVADQQPCETVAAAADLLRRHSGDYTWLDQADLRVPVRPVSTQLMAAARGVAPEDVPPQRADADVASYTPKSLEQAIAARASRARDKSPAAAPAEAEPPAPLEILDMRERFSGYEPDSADATYQTRRIDLRRGSDCTCHLFEMYWGDLSRPQMWVIQNFIAFYQLLFFMCDLGSRAIDYARASYGTTWPWRGLKWSHRIAHVLLVLAIPILNLALLAFGASGLLAGYYITLALPSALIGQVIATVATAVVAAVLYSARRRLPVAVGPWLFVLVPAAGVGLALLLAPFDLSWAAPLVTWTIAAAAVIAMMYVYRRRRRGAVVVGWLFTLSITAWYFLALRRQRWEPDALGLFEAQLEVFRWHVTYPHWALWIGFSVCTACCLALSLTGAIKGRLDARGCEHARRAAATANLTLAVSGILVLAADLGLWQAIVLSAARLPLDLLNGVQPRLNDLFSLSIPVGVYGGSLAFLAAALFAVWLFLPAVLAEQRPPPDARRLGREVSLAFRRLAWSGLVVELMITAGLVVGALLWLSSWYTPEGRAADAHAVLAVGVVTFVLFTVRAAGAALRSVLDVALDVANWLRHDPPLRTPSARIAARFTSLLRHVCTWRDPLTGAGYDGIVFFAHSQGTVISAELLRYLKYVEERELPPHRRMPVYLFTMGNPLWQLYSLRFPDQYGWVRDDATPTGDFSTRPDPNELSVERWSNFYRSGDYVGRSLWRSDADLDTTDAWDRELRVEGRKRERCIGAGAHTHYWDATAPAIAEELDFLIAEASRGARLRS